MDDYNEGLPRWVFTAGGLALAILVLSGVGIALLQRFAEPPGAAPDVGGGEDARPTLERPTAAPTPTATPLPPDALALGSTVERTLTPQQPTHTYTLELTAGDLILIEAQPALGSPALITLDLINPQGVTVAQHQQPRIINTNAYRFIRTRIHHSGTYTLNLSGLNPFLMGPYTLTARHDEPGSLPTAQRFDPTAWQTVEKADLGVGVSFDAALTSPTEAHAWGLNAPGDEPVRIKVTGDVVLIVGAAGQPETWHIAQPQGDYSGVYEFAPRPNGVTLRITPRDAASVGSTYTISTEPIEGEPFTQWRGLLNAQNVEITHRSQRDEWVFYGQAGQRIALTANFFGGNIALDLTILSPQGDPLSPENQHLNANRRTHGYVFTLPGEGVYTVTAQTQANQLEYALSINLVTDDYYPDHPDELPLTTNIRASLTPGEASHSYIFNAQRGQRYAITAAGISGYNPFLAVRDPENNLLTDSQPFGNFNRPSGLWDTYQMGQNANRVVFTAAESGPHRVIVAHHANSIFHTVTTYSLRAEETSPFEPERLSLDLFTPIYTGELAVGQSEVGTIERDDHRHDYTIPTTGVEAEIVTVQVEGQRGMTPCVISPDINSGVTNTCPPDGTVRRKVVAGRDIRIHILPAHAQTGDYTIRVIPGDPRLADLSAATPLQAGQAVEPNPAGYTFEGQARDEVGLIFRYSGQPLYLTPVVLAPSGLAVDFTFDDDYPRYELTEDGTHYIAFVDWYNVSSSELPNLAPTPAEGYTIELTRLDGLPTAPQTALAPGDFVAGHLPHGYITHTYPLDVTPGQRVSLWPNAHLNQFVRVQIRDRRGRVIPLEETANLFYNPSEMLTFTPEEGETYTAHVSTGDPYASTDYTLTLQEGYGLTLTETLTLPPSGEASGHLTQPYEAHRWLISTEPKQEVNIRIEVEGLAPFLFTALVTTPTGEFVRATPNNNSVISFWAGNEGGLYSVLVFRRDGLNGFYTLTVTTN